MFGDVKTKKYEKDGAYAEETVGYDSGTGSGEGNAMLIMAPYAGALGVKTDKEAEKLHDIVGFRGATTWIFKVGAGDKSAYDTWHMPEAKISGGKPQYDLLAKYVEHRSFHQGVSFRGWSKDKVLIGGNHSDEWKAWIASSISGVLPANYEIEIDDLPQKYAAESEDHILNQLADHTIQVTQPKEVRDRYWEEVVEAVGMHYTEEE